MLQQCVVPMQARNIEAQLDSPQQGQLGASVAGRDNVRQACIGKERLTATTQREAKYLMFPAFLLLHVLSVFGNVPCPWCRICFIWYQLIILLVSTEIYTLAPQLCSTCKMSKFRTRIIFVACPAANFLAAPIPSHTDKGLHIPLLSYTVLQHFSAKIGERAKRFVGIRPPTWSES